MTPWNCHLNKNYIPCRKSSIIYVEEVFFNKQLHFKKPLHSLRTVRHAFVQVSLKKMPSCFIPLVTLLAQKKKHGPCECGRPNGAAGRKTQEQRKNKKTHWKNRETKKHIGKQKTTKLLSRPPLSKESGTIFFCVSLFFWCFQGFFVFWGFVLGPRVWKKFLGFCVRFLCKKASGSAIKPLKILS